MLPLVISAVRQIKAALILLIFICPIVSYSQPPGQGQKVVVTNKTSNPVPVLVTNPGGGIVSHPNIPYRLNKNVGIQLGTDYFINGAKKDYMWVIEYIVLSSASKVDQLLIEIYDATHPVSSFRIEPGSGVTSFPTKLRIAEGERLRIQAVAGPGGPPVIAVHVSGYYEYIPK